MSNKYELYQFKVGEVLTLKKLHPCGCQDWGVIKTGQEIGIRCIKCNHIISIKRRNLEKSIKCIKSDSVS